MSVDAAASASIGIVAGGGTLPGAVAGAVEQKGQRPVLFGIRGFCDPATLLGRTHHWVAIGQLGRFYRLMRAENCRDVIFIGSLVRPALRELRLDLETLRAMPALIAAFRGGDDHLLTSFSRLIEAQGFEVRGVGDVAPQLTVPSGAMTAIAPNAAALDDIARGRAALLAISDFDVGQAAVVIDGHVVALEDIEGTDALLARIARLRAERRIRTPTGRGVLVKAPKFRQDLRFDMPTLGPQTIAGAEKAQLAGIAVVAGQTLVAEPQAVVTAAERAGLFVVGVPT
jgi:DUF1009 family protein